MLRVSTRARYAVRAMLELALREGLGPVSLREIARAQRVSPRYLEQLTIPLRGAGLIHAARGPGGGYELSRPPDQITAREIVEAVEAPVRLLDCLHLDEVCDQTDTCAARRLWSRVNEAVNAVLSDTTLSDMCMQQRAAMGRLAPFYQI